MSAVLSLAPYNNGLSDPPVERALGPNEVGSPLLGDRSMKSGTDAGRGADQSGRHDDSASKRPTADRIIEHWSYLQAISQGQLTATAVDRGLADIAWHTWLKINKEIDPQPDVPDVRPGHDGEILYIWDQGEHHCEIEFLPDQPCVVFYMNRLSNKDWSEEYDPSAPIPARLKEALRWFGPGGSDRGALEAREND